MAPADKKKEPDWIAVLRAEVVRTSQAKAARRLRVSSGTVSSLLKGTYGASTERMERRVRGELMQETCICPVFGEISKRRCQDEQKRPFAPTNPQRVAVYRACRKGCKHSTLGGGS